MIDHRHLLLVDASGIAFRAFHVASPVHRDDDGEPIGATLRFAEITWRLLGEAQADPATHGCAVFDIPGPNFRHKLYPAYKSNRDPSRRLILDGQMPYMKHVAETLGLHPIDAEGFEADDVIASLAWKARQDGIRVTIVSSDKDFGQLVADNEVEIVDPMQNRRILEKDVVERWGVPVSRVTHLQALAGDSADGYPGIAHCGAKRAAELIRAYGGITGIFNNLGRIPFPALKNALRAPHARERVDIFHKLAKLRRDVPINPDIWEVCAIRPVMRAHLVAILKAIKAPPWALQSIFHLDQVHVRLVPSDSLLGASAFQWWNEELKFPGQRLPEVPQCGFYKRRLVKNGAELPAMIWAEPSPQPGHCFLKCTVGGKARDPFEEWPRLAMSPIKRPVYEKMVEAMRVARFDDRSPLNDPSREPEDITKAPKSINPRRRA